MLFSKTGKIEFQATFRFGSFFIRLFKLSNVFTQLRFKRRQIKHIVFRDFTLVSQLGQFGCLGFIKAKLFQSLIIVRNIECIAKRNTVFERIVQITSYLVDRAINIGSDIVQVCGGLCRRLNWITEQLTQIGSLLNQFSITQFNDRIFLLDVTL